MENATEAPKSSALYRNGHEIECWLTDMDGVLVHENQAVPGAAELIQRWVDTSKRFLVLTNNSIFTPRDLAARLSSSGLEIPEENIWTSALATAQFLKDQVQGSESGNRRPGTRTARRSGWTMRSTRESWAPSKRNC